MQLINVEAHGSILRLILAGYSDTNNIKSFRIALGGLNKTEPRDTIGDGWNRKWIRSACLSSPIAINHFLKLCVSLPLSGQSLVAIRLTATIDPARSAN